MRVAGYALLGFLGGAAAGFALAFLFVLLWYDVFRIGGQGGDGLSGLATFLVLGVALPLVGGGIGAYWLAARARAGAPAPTAVIGALILAFILFFAFFAIVGVF